MIERSREPTAASRVLDGLVALVSKVGLAALLIVVLVALFGLLEPRFFNRLNLINILRNSSFLMIAATGQMLVLIVGGFDLSVGAVAALASVVAASAMAGLLITMPEATGSVIALGVLAGLMAGAAVGLVNGLCVAFLKVSPFMVTLGTLSIASGIALYHTTGIPVYGMPDAFTKGFGRAIVFGLPLIAFFAVATVLAVWFVQARTKFGRYLYAIGGNLQAARVSGVPTQFTLIAAYVLCSLLAAGTGVLLTARVGSGQATIGSTLMLESIAAAVIGGVSLRGGIGRVELVALAALFLSIVTNGMNLIRIDSKMQTVVLGVVLILAVATERAIEMRKRRG